MALHPDGQILGTGTDDAVVHVWETRSQNVRLNCFVLRLCYATTVLRILTLLADLLVVVHDGIVAASIALVDDSCVGRAMCHKWRETITAACCAVLCLH